MTTDNAAEDSSDAEKIGPPPQVPSGAVRDLAHRSRRPNVRIHLRGGSVIRTRAANVRTSRNRYNGELIELGIEDIEAGWPRVPYFRLDSVDAVEWIES